MGQNTTLLLGLSRAVRQAVLDRWDPIGVRDVAEAQDEYDSYLPSICRLLDKGSANDLFNYLWWLETVHMGLTGDRDTTSEFVEFLTQLGDKFRVQAEDRI